MGICITIIVTTLVITFEDLNLSLFFLPPFLLEGPASLFQVKNKRYQMYVCVHTYVPPYITIDQVISQLIFTRKKIHHAASNVHL